MILRSTFALATCTCSKSDAFLRSINLKPTAEAWSGVGYAEYRSEENQRAYEALCEANLLDNGKSDIWAQLSLVHLRLGNWALADHCFHQLLECELEGEEYLLEVSREYVRHEQNPAIAEIAARRAVQIKTSGQGYGALADSLAQQGRHEEAVKESIFAMKLLAEFPEAQFALFERAQQWCKEVGDPSLSKSLGAAYKEAQAQSAQMAASVQTPARSSD